MTLGDRIVVVGPCGAGKTTVARAISRRHGHAVLELDALRHLPGWTAKPDELVNAEIETFIGREPRWVIDGNYKRHRETIWSAADTIIWLDLPRHVVMTSLLARTLRRVVTREELWNGNRERLPDVLSRDPDRSILLWGWTTFDTYRAEYTAAMTDERWAHLRWIRARTREDAGT